MKSKSRIALASIVSVVCVALLVGSFTLTPGGISMASPKVVATGVEGTPQDVVTVEEVAREGERNMLQINNQTPFIVIVYIGGVRLGWMRPYRVGLIRGLMVGYHRLYSHSQYGTTSWGPRDVWIPGTWNLLY
jgi:hypothetical protein